MTVIVGIVAQDRVVMAADSIAVGNDGRRYEGIRKIRRFPVGREGDALIGVAGLHALGMLIERKLHLPVGPDPTDDADCDAWAYGIAEAILDLASEAKLLDDEGGLDGSALLAYAGRLWHVGHLFADRMPDFAAVGCGSQYALGALHALDRAPDDRLGDAEGAVREAVAAALRFDTGCGGGIQVEESK
jgi:ATP-dependent protease HslVU (ClpYQ) peptidase subunit